METTMRFFGHRGIVFLLGVVIGGLFFAQASAQETLAYRGTPDVPEGQRMAAAAEAQGHARLGLAGLERARETGDPTHYTKAEASFKKALDLDPQNVEAMGGMGSLCLSRHRFAEALAWGERAVALTPHNAFLHGVVVDACVELGDYARAAEVLQAMVDLRPGLNAYARVSYLRELTGDHDGAVEAMEMAVRTGGPNARDAAWCQAQLGNLRFGQGDLGGAEAQYRAALVRLPGYAHALAGLAKVRAAQRDYAGGAAFYEQAVAALPEHAFVEALGDVYRAMGQGEEAGRRYADARALLKAEEAGGANVDLEMALFEADHGLDPKDALARARREMARRPSNIHAADALAWALYRNGACQDALSTIRQALRLGTQDPLMLFHAGMIACCAGETAPGRAYLERALAINPRFSALLADEAAAALRKLEEANE
jgi:tetratricopeptide (TPR) repeat protein